MEGPDIVVGTPSVLLGHVQAKVQYHFLIILEHYWKEEKMKSNLEPRDSCTLFICKVQKIQSHLEFLSEFPDFLLPYFFWF